MRKLPSKITKHKKTIWGHTIVRNEERFLWYVVTSVIDYLDKLLLWDTGSTDKTLAIIKLLQEKYKDKIIFKQFGSVDPMQFTQARQEMLKITKSDWFMIIDGDEVWWDERIKEITNLIQEKGDELDLIVSTHYCIVGDLYHYQEDEAAKYKIGDREGHLNIRAFNRKIPGLHFDKPHGQQGLYTGDNVLIQDLSEKRRIFINQPAYFHLTHIIRSSSRKLDKQVIKRKKKYSYEIGIPFSKKFKYPEVFSLPAPSIVLSPWNKMSFSYLLFSLLQTPLKKIKRRLIKSDSGY